jgi:hypothetical protein
MAAAAPVLDTPGANLDNAPALMTFLFPMNNSLATTQQTGSRTARWSWCERFTFAFSFYFYFSNDRRVGGSLT